MAEKTIKPKVRQMSPSGDKSQSEIAKVLDEFARWKKEMINETSEYFCEICGGTHRDYSKKRKDKETTENDLVKRLATLTYHARDKEVASLEAKLNLAEDAIKDGQKGIDRWMKLAVERRHK
jgi:hypothetical protein